MYYRYLVIIQRYHRETMYVNKDLITHRYTSFLVRTHMYVLYVTTMEQTVTDLTRSLEKSTALANRIITLVYKIKKIAQQMPLLLLT